MRMNLKNLFKRRPAPSRVSKVHSPTEVDPLAPGGNEVELAAAWSELEAAAKASGVETFSACTRTGQPWTENPEAVRAVAATLREFPLSQEEPAP